MSKLRTEQLKLELASAEQQILELPRFTDNSFTAACYNDNSISELAELSVTSADKTDCKTWKISAAEWTQSVLLALETKLLEKYIKNLEDEILNVKWGKLINMVRCYLAQP